MVMVDDAGIDARSSHKKELEHHVSIDEPRPAAAVLARRVQASTTINIISSQDLKTQQRNRMSKRSDNGMIRASRKVGSPTLTLPLDETYFLCN
jgi:L-aminopeptidase/D-esterase-like protein